ncbi:hypothetical protein SANTM175S_03425 [Streptomyces antimycoticus]
MTDARVNGACAQRSRLRAVADGRDAGPQMTTMAAPLRRAGGEGNDEAQ